MAGTSRFGDAWSVRIRATRACVYLCLLVLTKGVRSEAAPKSKSDGHLTLPMRHKGGFSVVHARASDQKRRRRALLGDYYDDDLYSTMPLHGSVKEHGYYYVDVSLGTPPKEFQVIVDTGSTLTYVPCVGCGTACGVHTGAPHFSAEESSTCTPVQCLSPDCSPHEGSCGGKQNGDACVYHKSYAEGSSVNGKLMKDLLYLGGGYGNDKSVVFGCTIRESGGIHTQVADGLMGLGNGANSLPFQLAATYDLPDAFSLCYGAFEGGGAVTFGKLPRSSTGEGVTDTDATIPALQYTPLIPTPMHPSYYVVDTVQWRLGNNIVAGENDFRGHAYGTVLDSGTTFTYLPTAVFGSFKNIAATYDLPDAFSLCYGAFEGGGAVTFGKLPRSSTGEGVTDTDATIPALQYTPLIPTPMHPSYYVVDTVQWRLGNNIVAGENDFRGHAYGTVLDSGTTFTYLPTAVFGSFKNILDQHITENNKLQKIPGPDPDFPEDVCYGPIVVGLDDDSSLTSAPTQQTLSDFFPNLTLTFQGGLELMLPPANYLFIHSDAQPNTFCVGVMDNGSAGTLVGGITTRNVLVEYDMSGDGPGKVGLAVADCEAMLLEHGGGGGSDGNNTDNNNNTGANSNATDAGATGDSPPPTLLPPPPPTPVPSPASSGSVAPTGFIVLLCLVGTGYGLMHYGRRAGWFDEGSDAGGAGGKALRTAVTAAKKGNEIFQEKWNELKQSVGQSNVGYVKFGLDDRTPKGRHGVELPPLLARR